jgi:hypothetical protein
LDHRAAYAPGFARRVPVAPAMLFARRRAGSTAGARLGALSFAAFGDGALSFAGVLDTNLPASPRNECRMKPSPPPPGGNKKAGQKPGRLRLDSVSEANQLHFSTMTN